MTGSPGNAPDGAALRSAVVVVFIQPNVSPAGRLLVYSLLRRIFLEIVVVVFTKNNRDLEVVVSLSLELRRSEAVSHDAL